MAAKTKWREQVTLVGVGGGWSRKLNLSESVIYDIRKVCRDKQAIVIMQYYSDQSEAQIA